MKPAIPLTDPRFVYTPSHRTDIRARFEAVRAAQKAAVVQPIRKAK